MKMKNIRTGHVIPRCLQLVALMLACVALPPKVRGQDCCSALLNSANIWTAFQTMPVIDSGGRYSDVRAFGAVLNGTTDDTAALNAAIADARTKNRVVYIPAGTLKITSTIVIDGSSQNPVMIEGAGSGSGLAGGSPNFPEATKILWGGSAASTSERPMMKFTLCNAHGHGVKGVKFDNNNVNAHGFEVDRSQYGTFEDVAVVNLVSNISTSYGVKVWSAVTGATTSWNYFKDTYVNGNYDGSGGQGRCLWLHGTGANDACVNTFINTTVNAGGTRNGIELGFCDNNTFLNTWSSIWNGTNPGTGWGVYANYNNGQSTAMPNHNLFFYLTTKNWLNTLNAANSTRGNTVIGMDDQGGTEAPTINSGFLHRIVANGEMLGGFTGGMNTIPFSAIDWRDGDVQMKDLGVNTTFAMSNPQPGQTLKVIVRANGFGITWPTTVPYVVTPSQTIQVPIRWPGGSAPAASGYSKYEFTFVDGSIRFIFATGTVNGS